MSWFARHAPKGAGSVFFALVLISLGSTAAGVLILGLGTFLFAWLSPLNPSVAAAVIAATAAALTSVFSLIATRLYEQKARTRSEQHPKRVECYEVFMKFFFRMLSGVKDGNATTEAEMLAFMREFTPAVMIWGADPVLKEFAGWRSVISDPARMKADPLAYIHAFNLVVLAMRRDLGHRNRGVDEQTIATMYLDPASVASLKAPA